MSLRETSVNSYDAGHKPYFHDPKRGKWEGKWDFHLACFANSFGMRTFFTFTFFMKFIGRAYITIPFVISTLLYIIPIFFLQSFLGQFSSTGFISVYRISPLFKGIGYVTLILNFFSAIYNSSIASYPLLFFLKSFQTNTTWMYCDNAWNTPNCSELADTEMPKKGDLNDTGSMQPVFEYFYHEIIKISHDEHVYDISWTIILGELVVWVLVGYFLVHGISLISKFVRYNVIGAGIISVILFIRICCLPELHQDTAKLFSFNEISVQNFFISWMLGPMATSLMLGRGWGIPLTLASYQPFQSNIEANSFIIPSVMTAVALIFGFMLSMIEEFVGRRVNYSMEHFNFDNIEYLLVVLPYFFGKIEASQFWSMLFFLMFFLSELTLIIIQAFCIVTALVDEYIFLRNWKREVSICLCAICFILSTFFATDHLLDSIQPLLSSGYLSQTIICFLEIMIVVWIYGHERFLRDVSFVLQRSLDAWKFRILRYVTPVFVIVSILLYLLNSLFHVLQTATYMQVFIIFMKGIPWIIIPGYIIAKLVTTIGTIPERLRRCLKPNDWYPANPADKYKYDLIIDTSEVSQQLLEINDTNIQ